MTTLLDGRGEGGGPHPSPPNPSRDELRAAQPRFALRVLLGRYRWLVCALLFLATTINYIDRQILSLLKSTLDAELHWTNAEFGLVNSAVLRAPTRSACCCSASSSIASA